MMSYEKDLRKGPWSLEEDNCLRAYVTVVGERRWDAIAKATGLHRSGKSCRLRWLNYLRPNLNHSPLSDEEEQLISRLHQKWGNKWARIARRLPGRTDNEIKNYWRAYTRKKTTQFVVDQTNQNTHYCTPNSSDISSVDDVKEEMVSSNTAASSEVDDVVLMRARSPYEDHLLNWITPLEITVESNELGSYEGYPEWSYLNDTLWDLDLFRF